MTVFYDRFERHDHATGLKAQSTHYCPGCGHGLVHKLLAEAIDRAGKSDPAAAELLLPDARVYPAPRSQISIRMFWRSSTFRNWTLARLGKRAWVSSRGPYRRASSGLSELKATTTSRSQSRAPL